MVQIQPYDPEWPLVAEQRLKLVRDALSPLDDGFTYDHIGSTAVPGLSAKPVVDLQVRVTTLPADAELDPLLAGIGFERAHGSRPDSPGVRRDAERGSEIVPDDVWDKHLFFLPGDLPSILHIRQTRSPFGRHTMWFRDWLRDNPDQRDRYQELKIRLGGLHAGDADYDDYTRAKTVFFDEVQHEFENWRARAR